MIGLLGAALLGAAHADPSPELTFGAKTRPVGMAVLTDLWLDAAGEPTETGLQVGPGADVYFFWYEAQLRARGVVYGGFLVFNGWAAAEPGWFKRADDPDGPRQFSTRPLGRARLEINLRDPQERVWLYVRNTGWTRHRAVAEYDPFRDQTFPAGLELSGEHSTALMFGAPRTRRGQKLWLYGEITLEASRDLGWLDRLPRGGVIVEELTPALSMDLDFYWSQMDNAIGGPGALVVLWWTPPG